MIMSRITASCVILFATSQLIAQVPPEKALATFKVNDPELEWTLWAHEPMFSNTTCMDIDHLGRVWVCESVNYRHTLFRKPPNRPEGDRILILEDSKGSGKADKVTVFYQAPDLLAPLGIAVAKDPVGPSVAYSQARSRSGSRSPAALEAAMTNVSCTASAAPPGSVSKDRQYS